jgi:hypothetical protein
MSDISKREPTYYHGIWFVGDGQTGDWMAKLFKREGKWVLDYRFRYYDKDNPGNGPHSGKDRKSWYSCVGSDDSDEQLEKIVEAANKVAAFCALHYGGTEFDFVLLQCLDSDPKFLFELGSRPWVNIKREVTP